MHQFEIFRHHKIIFESQHFFGMTEPYSFWSSPIHSMNHSVQNSKLAIVCMSRKGSLVRKPASANRPRPVLYWLVFANALLMTLELWSRARLQCSFSVVQRTRLSSEAGVMFSFLFRVQWQRYFSDVVFSFSFLRDVDCFLLSEKMSFESFDGLL